MPWRLTLQGVVFKKNNVQFLRYRDVFVFKRKCVEAGLAKQITPRLGVSTIKRMEGADSTFKSSVENVLKVQQALEDAGVIFIDQNEDGGPGVRLRKSRDQ